MAYLQTRYEAPTTATTITTTKPIMSRHSWLHASKAFVAPAMWMSLHSCTSLTMISHLLATACCISQPVCTPRQRVQLTWKKRSLFQGGGQGKVCQNCKSSRKPIKDSFRQHLVGEDYSKLYYWLKLKRRRKTQSNI